LAGRDPKKLESTAADLDAASLVVAGDVADSTDVQTIFQKAIDQFGAVDVVINSAGVMHSGLVGEMDPSEWWQDYVCLHQENPPIERLIGMQLTVSGNQPEGDLYPRTPLS
jgi:NAD(P)-dependent dehydrogenase (short-subunit alcohol dehydrogenase family)